MIPVVYYPLRVRGFGCVFIKPSDDRVNRLPLVEVPVDSPYDLRLCFVDHKTLFVLVILAVTEGCKSGDDVSTFSGFAPPSTRSLGDLLYFDLGGGF